MPRTNRLYTFVLLIPLTGCSEYLDHHDTLTLAAGDANRYNRLLQAEDPFNERAFDTKIEGDGNRAVRVVRRYQEPFAVSWPTVTPNSTSAAAPATGGQQ